MPQINPSAPSGSISLPDWLPPLVWLDLVRCMRMRGFVISFLLFQLLVTWAGTRMIEIGFGQGPSDKQAEFENMAQWAILALFIVIFPISAYWGLRSDTRYRLLEPLHLTGIRPLGILTGHWISLMLRATVLASMLSPWIVLRYYAFASNPVLDLVYLAELLVVCFTLCACALAIAAPARCSSRIILLAVAVFCWAPYVQTRFYAAIFCHYDTPYYLFIEIFFAAYTIGYLVAGSFFAFRVGVRYCNPYQLSESPLSPDMTEQILQRQREAVCQKRSTAEITAAQALPHHESSGSDKVFGTSP